MTITMSIGQMREIIGNLNVIVDEVTLNFTKEGMDFRVVDVSHVCMLSAQFPAESFEVFDCEESSIAVEVRTLVELVKGSKTNDRISIEWDNESTHLNVTKGFLGLLSKSVLKLERSGSPMVPDLLLPTVITVGAEWFEMAIKHASDVSCLAKFSAIKHEDRMTDLFSIIGSNESEEISIGAEIVIDVEANTTFSMTYLKPMSKRIRMTAGKDEHITLMFGDSQPLVINFASSTGEYSYFLAPRIDGDI